MNLILRPREGIRAGAFDNTLSQLIEFYPNASVLAWNGNNYNLYALNSITMQHPQSTIPINSILSLPGYDVAGIKFNEVQDFTLANNNTFWADFNGSFDNYLHVWLTQSSTGNIDGNTFNEGMNIHIEKNSTATITNNTFQKSTQPNGGPGGIYAHSSTVTIGDLNASPFSNYLYDGAAILIEEPIESYVYRNKITGVDSETAIEINAQNALSSRTKVQHNNITAATGIGIGNLVSWPNTGNTNHRVFINDNTINTLSSANTTSLTTDVFGIIVDSSPGTVIGNNILICSDVAGGAVPNASNNDKAIGIDLRDSPNSIVGTNKLHYYGRGLELNGDASGDATYFPENDQYYCNEFLSCFYGIFLEIGTDVNHFGKNTTGVDNIWDISLLPNNVQFTPSFRIWDGRNSTSTIDYYNSGGLGTNMFGACNTIYIVDKFGNANLCTEPDNHKNAILSPTIISSNSFELYPNPSNDQITIASISGVDQFEINIYSSNGILKLKQNFHKTKSTTINVSAWIPGVYVVRILSTNQVEVHRLVVL